MAYSSIGHVGYALAGLSTGTNEGIQSSVIYISIYVIMNLGLFSCMLMMKRNDKYFETIEDLRKSDTIMRKFYDLAGVADLMRHSGGLPCLSYSLLG